MNMNSTLIAGLAVLTVLSATPALAASQMSNGEASPGMPGRHAVDPAPDAPGPFLQVSQRNFYHPMVRERALQKRIAAASNDGQLSAIEARDARGELNRVAAEAKMQIARHGSLRDWDRERLNDMMDHLVEHFSVLRS